LKHARKDIEEPMLVKSRTATADPSRAKLRIESDEPRCVKSNNDIDDPNVQDPNTEKAEPFRMQLRIDIDDPMKT
jgi:hypothetical protein